MVTRKVLYSVGISNKFSAFEEVSDSEQAAPTHKDDKTKVPTSSAVLLNKSPKSANRKVDDGKNVTGIPKVLETYEAKTGVLTEEQLRDTRAIHPKKGSLNRDVKHKSGSNRVFDRKSGTGRGKEMKKQGEGGHNWGGVVNGTKSITESRYVSIDGVQETVESNNEKVEMIDYLSYKEQQLSKRSSLPNAPSRQTNVPTDQEFRNSGYVKYLKREPDIYNSNMDKPPKVDAASKHSAYHKANSGIGAHNYSISFGEHKSTSKRNKNKLSDQNDRTKTKVAPDVADHSLFPSL